MAEENREELDVTPSEDEPETEPSENGAAAPRKRPIEKFYDNFEGIPLKALDNFIGACVALLIAVVVFGYIRAHR